MGLQFRFLCFLQSLHSYGVYWKSVFYLLPLGRSYGAYWNSVNDFLQTVRSNRALVLLIINNLRGAIFLIRLQVTVR